MSSDFGPLIRRGVDRKIVLTARLAAAYDDQRHPSDITHSVRDLNAPRIYPIACADEDDHEANALRRDPLFKLAWGAAPWTVRPFWPVPRPLSRLEHAATTQDQYPIARAYVNQFIATYGSPPAIIVWDRDPAEDATHGSRSCTFTTITTPRRPRTEPWTNYANSDTKLNSPRSNPRWHRYLRAS